MTKLTKRMSKTLGLPPGTPVYIGEKHAGKTRVTVFDYDQSDFKEQETHKVEDCFPYRDKPSITWINVDGIENTEIIEKIDAHFGIHHLVLEDIVNTSQRPKIEDFGNYIFVVLKMIYAAPQDDEIISEQVSLIIGDNYVISFQEKEGDVFNPIRDRIRNSKGRIRKMGADYLAYALLDSIIDSYFVILEKYGDKIENLEDRIMSEIAPSMPNELHRLKREMISLRKNIWPLREMINNLQKSETKLIKKITSVYLRDVYDHTIQIIDTIESFRDMLSGLHDIYLSSISNRMNEIMKVLTIFAAIFIPLTFMAGIYGMNFEFMPELKWKYGYFIILGLMAGVGFGMLAYFKRKKWI